MPKESVFKVQTISGKHGEKRKTFAKCKIDVAQFCSCEATGSKEVVLPLRYVQKPALNNCNPQGVEKKGKDCYASPGATWEIGQQVLLHGVQIY